MTIRIRKNNILKVKEHPDNNDLIKYLLYYIDFHRKDINLDEDKIQYIYLRSNMVEISFAKIFIVITFYNPKGDVKISYQDLMDFNKYFDRLLKIDKIKQKL